MKFLDRISIYYLIIVFLVSLYIVESFTFGIDKIIWQALLPLLATITTDITVNYLKLKRLIRPISSTISGLIIGQVSQFGESGLTLVLIGVAAMLAKFFLKIEGRPIFNPAASGLFLGMIFFSSYPAWWGGGSVPWVFLIWIPILLYKLRRWAPMVGFLIPVVSTGGISVLTSASALFFISVMLIEPKTSPATIKLGLIYGVVVAIGYLIIGRFLQFDPFIPSLLIGNLTARLIARYS